MAVPYEVSVTQCMLPFPISVCWKARSLRELRLQSIELMHLSPVQLPQDLQHLFELPVS